jgi:hypothetical protein
MQAGAHAAAARGGARGSAGSVTLLGIEPMAGFDERVAAATGGAHQLDIAAELQELHFDYHDALVSRSQREGASFLLPKRFVQARCSVMNGVCMQFP